jgi:putative MATE family efflux protein
LAGLHPRIKTLFMPSIPTAASFKLAKSRSSPKSTSSRETTPGLWDVSWPMFAEMFVYMLGGLLTLWLVSRISDQMTAVFSLVNQIVFGLVVICRTISVGLSVVVAQHVGGGDVQGARSIARVGLASSVWLGVLCCVVLFISASGVLALMQAPGELMAHAVPYLRAMGVVFVVDVGTFAITAVLRAQGHTRVTMWLGIGALLLQLAIALPLMLGLWGLPALGIWGLLLGQLVGRAAVLAVGLWQWRSLLAIRMTARDWVRLQRRELKEILHIGLPGAAEGLAYRMSFIVIMAMIAGMGTQAIATHAYTFQVIHFILLFGMVAGFGTEIVVGHCVGAGHLHRANRVMFSALRWGLLMSTGVAIAAALMSETLIGVFTQDEDIIALGAKLIWLCVFLESGRTFNLVVINGLRATSDVHFPLVVGVCSMFAVAAGFSWLLGVHWGWGLVGVWIATALDEWLRGLAMLMRWRSKAWLKFAPHAHRRIRLKRDASASQRYATKSAGEIDSCSDTLY